MSRHNEYRPQPGQPEGDQRGVNTRIDGVVVAQSLHQCQTCERTIQKGEQYRHLQQRKNGVYSDRRDCLECHKPAAQGGAA